MWIMGRNSKTLKRVEILKWKCVKDISRKIPFSHITVANFSFCTIHTRDDKNIALKISTKFECVSVKPIPESEEPIGLV